jgi:hypothetical protein
MRGQEQRAIGHGVAVRQRFSAFDRCADFEMATHDHHWRRPEPAQAEAGAGTGRRPLGSSRDRRSRQTSARWQEPLRQVPDEDTSEAEVASCWQPHGRRGATGAGRRRAEWVQRP